MAYEQRDNEGAIFKNEKREKDTHPHGTGKAMIGGVMYWVSAWTKEGSKGRFQSLSFRPMDDSGRAPSQGAKSAQLAPGASDLDDVPF
jgi:hypothetical protein